VVTSGGDQVFPRGLPVGVIQSIVPDPQHQPYTAITIKPAADLTQLEEVLVITGTITGTLIGLLQDGLTNHPFGVYGIAKGVIGYIAASIGFTVDVENMLNRVLLNFGFCLFQSGMLYLITRRLLADPSVHLQPVHQLICAVVNAIVAIPVFLLLDRFKIRE
jgi:rod shape-determining protein MreD